MISANSLLTILSFFLGLLVGIILDRLFLTKWVDQISKRKLQLFSQAVVTFVVVFVFLLLNIKTLIQDVPIDKEIYWIFALIIGSVQGIDLSENRLKNYIDLFKNGKNKNEN